jgi:hypothetical protein
VYAYLLSTLPSFGPYDTPPMTVDVLVERCRPYLGESELRALTEPEAAAVSGGEPGDVARRWLDGERQLRNAVARRRSAAWGVSPEPYLREHEGFRVEIEDGVGRAYDAGDPLERERALDALRWRLLDDLAGVVPWGFAALFAYGQRLRIAQAWASRNVDDGRRWLQETLDRLEEHHA